MKIIMSWKCTFGCISTLYLFLIQLDNPCALTTTLLTDAHEAYKCSQKVQKYGEVCECKLYLLNFPDPNINYFNYLQETEKLLVEVFKLSGLHKVCWYYTQRNVFCCLVSNFLESCNSWVITSITVNVIASILMTPLFRIQGYQHVKAGLHLPQFIGIRWNSWSTIN